MSKRWQKWLRTFLAGLVFLVSFGFQLLGSSLLAQGNGPNPNPFPGDGQPLVGCACPTDTSKPKQPEK